jgi:hypothetical protein
MAVAADSAAAARPCFRSPSCWGEAGAADGAALPAAASVVTIRAVAGLAASEAETPVAAAHRVVGDPMESILSELVSKLQKAHRDRLVSVILYGSAAAAGGQDRLSDFNVLSVLKDVTTEDLRNAEPVFHWWRQQKNPAPILLSEQEVRTSTDCFPMEFHDMRECRQVLFGEDVIAGLAIDKSFYRGMVEHELRAKLLRLRQKAGGVLSDNELLLRLLMDSISTFCVLFRHAVWLAGGTPQFGKKEVIAAAQTQFGIDPQPFLTLLDVREGKLKPRDLQPLPLFGEYLSQIHVVLDAVDRMEK